MADTTYKIPHDTLKKEISKPADFTPPEELYKELISRILTYHPSADISMIEKAYKVADASPQGTAEKVRGTLYHAPALRGNHPGRARA